MKRSVSTPDHGRPRKKLNQGNRYELSSSRDHTDNTEEDLSHDDTDDSIEEDLTFHDDADDNLEEDSNHDDTDDNLEEDLFHDDIDNIEGDLSHNNTNNNTKEDLCRHNVKPLWDNPDAPGAPQLIPKGKKRRNVRKAIAADLPPLNDIEEIFEVAVRRAYGEGLAAAVEYFAGKPIRVATMCSGTESPLLSLELISKALQKNHGADLPIKHVFSAEIVPYKQAYIERNFHPEIIFRDILELATGPEATTAYGTKMPIPSDVDLLVAGTSCVDFSRLNSKSLKLADKGESGDTFRALVDYIVKYRPPMAILENVQSAPWDEIKAILTNNMQGLDNRCRQAFSDVWEADDKAYAAEMVQLDTKDYYIPQTRQRGYMIAIDRERHEDADMAVKVWAQKLVALQQKASSPVESFLIGDAATPDSFGSSALAKKKPRAEVDWDTCMARYQQYRSEFGLGSQRPLTHWVGGGSCTGPDHWDLEWVRSQVERIWDTLEICHLRSAQRGFDDCYKTRVLELTQNIDRFTDTQGQGFIACLTPHGMQFISTRGRALTGREALRLQGLPIHKLLLTHESQRDLLDLAGNAMTTTVVGTALLAALIVGHKAISIEGRRPKSLDNTVSTSVGGMKRDALLPHQTLDMAQYQRCTLDDLRSRASASTRRCLCEERTLTLGRSFKKCRLCGHTACERCAGIPRHDYDVISHPQPIEPSSFIGWITKCLPMRVQLVGLEVVRMEELYANCKSHGTPEGRDDWDIYKRAIEQALGEEMRFESVTRSQQWIVRYDAPHSYLELTVGETPCWRIFAKPARQEPNNSRHRWLLKNPFARMRIKPGDDLLAGEWELFLPIFLQCSLKIEGFGPMTKSWESHLGIEIKKPAVETVHTRLKVSMERPACQHIARSIDELVGEYELLEDCGAASRSLHKRVNRSQGRSVYFFLDPQRVGPPRHDRFVFSPDHHRLTFGEAREVIASIDPEWRQGRADAKEEPDRAMVECRFYGLWEACGATLQVFAGRPGLACAMLRRDVSITVSSGIALSPNPSARPQVCSADTMTFISWQVPCTEPEKIGWQLGPWRQVDQESEALALRPFTWLFQKSKDLDQFPFEWSRLSLPDDSTRCQSCSPDIPSIKWRPTGKPSGVVVPYEDERQAGAFERAMKARAKPFVTQTQLITDGCGGFIGCLQVGINITALAHRVLSRTPFGSGQAVELSWRLNTTYQWPLEVSFDKFTLPDNKSGEEEAHVFRQSEGNTLVELGRLRREQGRSLCWMKKQEMDGARPFLEQEIEEAYLPTLGWLAETMAKFPSQARGGVLADEVGYGKTATTLALIDATMNKASDLSLEKTGAGIVSKATLIIVPATLMAQWESQIAKFLGEGYPVLKIDNIRDLSAMTVAKMKHARIILLNWRVLAGDVYLRNLGAFAAIPECSTKAGRAYKTWLEQAVRRIDDYAQELGSCEDVEEFMRIHNERLAAASKNDDAAIPSRRLRGAAYMRQAKGGKKEPQAEDDRPLNKVATLKPFKLTQAGQLAGMKAPPIHLFNFHRIVIDEYTYLTDSESHSISCLRATNRWVLSGTPKLGDFADIKFLAGLLHVDLGVDDDSPIALQQSSVDKIRKGRTAAEKFRSLVQVHSPEWHRHRVQHAQAFLDHFARKNTAEIDEIQAFEMIKPVVLSWEERAVFMELQQQLYTQEIRLCRGSSNENDSDRVKRMKSILRASKSPEEALLKGCSHLEREHSDSNSNLNSDLDSGSASSWQNACESMIQQRRDERQEVEMELSTNLRHAVWLQRQLGPPALNGTHEGVFGIWQRDLMEERDPEGSVEIIGLLAEAEDKYSFDHQDDFYRDEPSKEQKAKEQAEWKRRKDAAKQAKAATKAASQAKKRAAANLAKSGLGLGPSRVRRNRSGGEGGGRATEDGGEGREEEPTEEEMDVPLAPIDSRRTKIDLKDRQGVGNALRTLMRHLRKLGSEFLSRQRALRFLTAAQALHLWQCATGPPPTCLGCGEGAIEPANISLLGLCGHLACTQCLEKRCESAGCVSEQCSSPAATQHVHVATDFGSTKQPGSLGTKLDSIVQLISEVIKDDQVLLFVQFHSLLEVVCNALKASGISYYAISDGSTVGAAKTAQDFQENQSTNKRRVLILNPSNESAAGLNLTNANHVVFVSPLLAKSRDEFHGSRTQCIGRARRYGQTKKVYVYDFLALHTIDVDLTEEQRGKRLVQEPPHNGEGIWRLKSEEEMNDDEKVKNWGSGWTRKDFFEE